MVRFYTTLELIDELRREVGYLIPLELYRKKLAYWKLSKYIYNESDVYGKSFIENILSRIKSTGSKNYNPNYKFSKEILNQFKKKLKENFNEKSLECIRYINLYEELNKDLLDYSYQQYHKYNPNMKADFFNIIDTINKAYWFGFLCADGSLIKSKKNKKTKLGILIQLSFKDKIFLRKFCISIGYNPQKIKERVVILKNKKYRVVYVKIKCRPMAEDLVNHGFISSKALRKNFPILGLNCNRNLILAWLRGYYDGDGNSYKTSIGSSNIELLQEIRKYFYLKYPIRQSKKHYIYYDDAGKIHIRKNYWILSLGARLFNEMSSLCKLYEVGLSRKDKIFSERLESLDKLKELIKNKEHLKELVFKYRLYELKDIFGVSIKIIKKLLREWNLEIPPKGYWKSNKNCSKN